MSLSQDSNHHIGTDTSILTLFGSVFLHIADGPNASMPRGRERRPIMTLVVLELRLEQSLGYDLNMRQSWSVAIPPLWAFAKHKEALESLH